MDVVAKTKYPYLRDDFGVTFDFFFRHDFAFRLHLNEAATEGSIAGRYPF
jgi:hypothetical protein